MPQKLEAYEELKQLGITDHIEVVRRWLRSGKLKGIPPQTRREGWRIKKSDLYDFILERAPGIEPILNTTIVVNKLPNSNDSCFVTELQEEIKQLKEEKERLRHQTNIGGN